MNSSDENSTDTLLKVQKDLSLGLLYTHNRINANVSKTLESTSFLYALIELLIEKGLLTTEDLDERKRQVAERLVKRFVDSGLGLMYHGHDYEKKIFNPELEEQIDRDKSKIYSSANQTNPGD